MKTKWKKLSTGVYCRSVNGRVECLTPKEYLKYQQQSWWIQVLNKYFL